MYKRSLLAVVFLIAAAGVGYAETYTIDPVHSNIGFSVRHLTISRVKGEFDDFSGTLNIDPKDTTKWSCEVTIQMASIDTRDSSRDKHLKSKDFFDVPQYPTMTFKSTKVVPKGKNRFEIRGNLTLHGITKPVTLNAELLGKTKDPWGNTRIGFTAATTIDRTDFGVNWSKAMETGGLVVGHDVGIALDIEAILKKK